MRIALLTAIAILAIDAFACQSDMDCFNGQCLKPNGQWQPGICVQQDQPSLSLPSPRGHTVNGCHFDADCGPFMQCVSNGGDKGICVDD